MSIIIPKNKYGREAARYLKEELHMVKTLQECYGKTVGELTFLYGLRPWEETYLYSILVHNRFHAIRAPSRHPVSSE